MVGSIEGIESASVQYPVLGGPDADRGTLHPSASVDVKTVGSKPLDEKLVGQIQRLVAGGLVGVERDQVRVKDLSTGDRFFVGSSTGELLRGSPSSRLDPRRALEIIWRREISRSLARIPGVKVTVAPGKHESDPFAVTATVPRTYFEMLWHRRNPAPEGRQPPTPPQEALDKIEQDVIPRIRRHIVGQLPGAEGVADAGELVTVTVFDDNWSWATLERMAQKDRERSGYGVYGWLRLETEPTADLITATARGRRYVLLSRQKAETILAFDTPARRDWELKSVRCGKDAQGRPVIEVELNAAGARRLGALSEVFRGNRLAILVDDKVIATPILESKLADKLQFRGNFDEAEAQRLVRLLQAGMIDAADTTSAPPENAEESAGQPTERKGDDQPQTDGAD